MTRPAPPRLGFLLNPIAGVGGPAGFNGSDGEQVWNVALLTGGELPARSGADRFLATLGARAVPCRWLTTAGDMGGHCLTAAGITPQILPVRPRADRTSAADTADSVRAMLEIGVDLILFAGGDGTARDIAGVVGHHVPLLGIPAGVKMQSAVFAVTAEAAAGVLIRWLAGSAVVTDAEIVDLDEAARRAGRLEPRLFGTARTLSAGRLMQGRKVGSGEVAVNDIAAIAAECAGALRPDSVWLLGPGRTVQAVAGRWGIETSLLGVDIIQNGRVLAREASDAQIADAVRGLPVQALLSPIGGQGFLLGRGNQQLIAGLLPRLTLDDLVVACTPAKLGGLGGGPLLIDVPDPAVAKRLSGYLRVITGLGQRAVVRVTSRVGDGDQG